MKIVANPADGTYVYDDDGVDVTSLFHSITVQIAVDGITAIGILAGPVELELDGVKLQKEGNV